jgi:hypothetical protein
VNYVILRRIFERYPGQPRISSENIYDSVYQNLEITAGKQWENVSITERR